MGVLTVSLSNDTEIMLRKMAEENFGSRKDALSKTIEMALSKCKKDKEESIARLKYYMDNPIKVKGKIPKTRDEIYDRKIFG